MPVSWRLADGCVLLESDEAGTLAEWMAALDTALSASGFRPGMAVVHDSRRRLSVPEPDEARERVMFLVSKAREASIKRWAVVIAPAKAHYGMVRMAQILTEFERGPKPTLRQFQALEEALAWARAEDGGANHGAA